LYVVVAKKDHKMVVLTATDMPAFFLTKEAADAASKRLNSIGWDTDVEFARAKLTFPSTEFYEFKVKRAKGEWKVHSVKLPKGKKEDGK
jgi:hypothetical protein